MDEKLKKATIRQTILAFISAFLTIGAFVSYALYEFNVIFLGKKENIISSCSFNISFKDENPINLVNAYPINDSEIIKYEPYTFYIDTKSSNCTNMIYEITMIDYCNECSLTNGICNVSDTQTANCNSDYKISGDIIKYQVKNTRTNEVTTGTNPFTNLKIEGSIVDGIKDTYEMKLWIDYNATEEDLYVYENGVPKENSNGTIVTKNFVSKIKVTSGVGNIEDKPNLDTSGANAPALASNMIPVYYDSTNDTWRKADVNNTDSNYRWYSYESSGSYKGMWANAVTVTEANRQTYLNAALGTAIPMSDINTMFVWIPRFSAVTPSGYNGGTAEAPGAIDVTFVNTNTPSIDAFWWDENNNGTQDSGEQKSGFWFAKFEISHLTLASSTTSNNLGCTNETCSNANEIIVKPNVVSLKYNSASNIFYASRSMEQTNNSFGFIPSEVDTHILKNNEWGAVTYLTQSIYGRCTSSTSCTEVTVNNNSSFYTGGNSYKTNINQSTTGTIYGIYDMNGGTWELVMGNYNDTVGSSGFASTWFASNTKYYNLYTGTSYTGHALTETAGWYNDLVRFVESSNPWFNRGGFYNIGSNAANAGVFGFSYNTGGSYGDLGSRISIVR